MKLLLFIAALFLQLTAQAQYQVQKGHWFISHSVGGYTFNKEVWKEYEEDGLRGQWTYKDNIFRLAFAGPDWGSAGLTSRKSTDDLTGINGEQSGARIWLQPQAGYFIDDNFMIGASVLLGIETDKYEGGNSSGKSRHWGIGIGPAMRYYFGKNIKRKPFAGFESRFDITKQKEDNFFTSGNTVDWNEYRGNGSRLMIRPFAGYACFLGKRWTVEGRIDYTFGKETTKRTSWRYLDETLDADYPQFEKTVITRNTIAISAGISYTF